MRCRSASQIDGDTNDQNSRQTYKTVRFHAILWILVDCENWTVGGAIRRRYRNDPRRSAAWHTNLD